MSTATLILISFVAIIPITNFALWLYFVLKNPNSVTDNPQQ